MPAKESADSKIGLAEIMNIIQLNPYRLLGIYSNSPTRERVANHNRMKAFLKVGRQLSFPLDLPSLLSPINRTTENIAEADAKLTLPSEQLKYAQFWFIKSTPIDDIAMNHLLAGDIDNAISIWQKKDNASSLQNRIVCALMQDDFATAIMCADKLYSLYSSDFINSVLGENHTVTIENLSHDFLDTLCVEVGAQKLLPYMQNDEWKQYVGDKIVRPLIESLQLAVNVAKGSRGKGANAILANARYTSGVKLMNEAKKKLAQLKGLLSVGDMQYQMIADKIAQEILQCGIDYFNNTGDDDAPQKARLLQNYALSIAVGNLVKDRCKENVSILNNVGAEYVVRKELAQLSILIKNLRGSGDNNNPLLLKYGNIGLLSRNVSDIKKIVDKSIPLLNIVKTKLGNNMLYMNISSAIVSSAVNALVEVVNLQQTLLMYDKNKLQSVIRDSVGLMITLGRMDMDAKTRNYYNGNKSTLDSINSKLNPSGCYIATMAYGDYNHPQVLVLRSFRDEYLAKRNWGRTFIRLYYRYSPALVERLKNHKRVNHLIRKILDNFVKQLKKHKF